MSFPCRPFEIILRAEILGFKDIHEITLGGMYDDMACCRVVKSLYKYGTP